MLVFDANRAMQTLLQAEHDRPTLAELEKSVGGLSTPSKMPWFGYNLPASKCITGSKLRQITGSVCSKCYAHKGRYVFAVTQAAMARRHDTVTTDLSGWAGRMAALLRKRAQRVSPHLRYFRWHDSGDLQSKGHLRAIIWIARNVPEVRFWLPTKEAPTCADMLTEIRATTNLTVRISMPMIGQLPGNEKLCTSTVGCADELQCPADTMDGRCGECRICWARCVRNVNYPQH